jgi:hypothetical protein
MVTIDRAKPADAEVILHLLKDQFDEHEIELSIDALFLDFADDKSWSNWLSLYLEAWARTRVQCLRV